MHRRAEIERYLARGLSEKAEARLRRHLRKCRRCREYYDRQVVLLRALTGDPATPTAAETDRLVGLALRGAGLDVQDRKRTEPGLSDRIVWASPLRLAGAAALILLVAVGAIWLLAAPTEAARVVRGRGLILDGEPVDLKATPGLIVSAGQKIEVGSRGVAELSLMRGGKVRVFPGSALSLSGPGERLDLAGGRVWCLIDPGGGPFAVRTDSAEARVVGTSFVVERRPSGETEVRVMEGEVEVEDAGARGTVRLQGGQKTRVAPDQPPGQPHRYNPRRDRIDWERFLRRIRRGIERAVREVRDFVEGL